jgi:hypothetical protein
LADTISAFLVLRLSLSNFFMINSNPRWAADPELPIQREEQAAYLVTIPNIAPLNFWQGHVTTVDMIQDCGNLHALSPSIDCLFRSIAVSIALTF